LSSKDFGFGFGFDFDFDFTYECLGHQCVEDSPCDVYGTQNEWIYECPNGVCYEG
jgi:hypothetical protein